MNLKGRIGGDASLSANGKAVISLWVNSLLLFNVLLISLFSEDYNENHFKFSSFATPGVKQLFQECFSNKIFTQ